MGDQQNISKILAALAAAQSNPLAAAGSFPGAIPTSTPLVNPQGYGLPPPDSTGSVDISGIRPDNSGSVSIADAIAKARGIAAEKGISYGSHQGHPSGGDPRRDPRTYNRSRSPSRSPPRPARDVFRDNYNPYRDERRAERRGGSERAYGRDRSFSPPRAGPGPSAGRMDVYAAQQFRDRGEGSPPMRRPGGMEENFETLPIDPKLVGLIIGRQGDNLRRIESNTQTRIQFLDTTDAGIRPCKITGNKTARTEAKTEITRLINEHNAARGMGSTDRFARGPPEPPSRPHGQGPPQGQGQGQGEDETSTQIMVPDRTVGLIIGRGGETIKDLQERSGCHVNIVGDERSVNGLRPVNLTGGTRAVQRAKDLIMEIVESDARQNASAPQQREPRRPIGGEMDAGSGSSDKDSLFVPKEAVGMIIGKGGDTIKELQSMTGCKVNILPPVGRDNEREVTMFGSRQAIAQAKQSILEKVEAVRNRSQPRREDGYNDRYSFSQQQQQQSAYGQDTNASAQQAPTAVGGAGAEGAAPADPYATYGGYENYMAMWYAAAMQQQQQQQQQPQQQYPPQSGAPAPPQGEQPGPPGIS